MTGLVPGMAAMRIGADAIVFSKAGGGTLLSCGMLSQTAQDGVGLLPAPHPGKQPRGGLVAKALAPANPAEVDDHHKPEPPMTARHCNLLQPSWSAGY